MALQSGMKTLSKSAMNLARKGVTSLDCIIGLAVED
jgi:hypothetical protein